MDSNKIERFIYKWRHGGVSHEEALAFSKEAIASTEYEIIYDHFNKTKPYLVRWSVKQTTGECLYVHRFLCSDLATPHDHPWDFKSMVLEGGYYNCKFVRDPSLGTLHEEKVWRDVGSSCEIKAGDIHRVVIDRERTMEEIESAPLTICLTDKRRRVWGFVEPQEDGYSWQNYSSFLDKEPSYTLAD